MIHGPGQRGELPGEVRGTRSSAPAHRGALESRARSYIPGLATPRVPLGRREGAGLANSRARERGAGGRGGPTGSWTSSQPMSSRNFRTPRPIPARMEGAAFDWVGAGRDCGLEA